MTFPKQFLNALKYHNLRYNYLEEYLHIDLDFHTNCYLIAKIKNNDISLELNGLSSRHAHSFFPHALEADFYYRHPKEQGPLFLTYPCDTDWEAMLDELLGFIQDILEFRHTTESAGAALACAKSFRNSPYQTTMLDSPLTNRIRNSICAWYPSAYSDFRDMLYLTKAYTGFDTEPDLFIHTDSNPPNFLDGSDLKTPGVLNENNLQNIDKEWYNDGRTRISGRLICEYDRFPDRKEDRIFADFHRNIGYAAEYKVKIESHVLGTYERSLIYIFCENEFFASNFLIPNRIALNTICRVRYGGGLGGARNRGDWIFNILNSLHVKYFWRDKLPNFINHSNTPDKREEKVYLKYPQIGGGPPCDIRYIMSIPSISWSRHGDVACYKIRNDIISEKKFRHYIREKWRRGWDSNPR